MANAGGQYTFYQSNVDGVQQLHLGWVSGATGAVPTSFPSGFINVPLEVKSVTRTGTGAFTILWTGPWYAAMVKFVGSVLQATYANTGACSVYVVEDHSTNTTTPEVKILVTNAAGTAVDPTTSDIVTLTLSPVIKPSY